MRALRKQIGSSGMAIMLLILTAHPSAKAQDAAIGREIAEQNCARCHAIGASDVSAHAEAPPFRAIAAKGRVDDMQEALAEGIVVGHADMPEFEFQPQQIEDFLAFLKGLAPAAQ